MVQYFSKVVEDHARIRPDKTAFIFMDNKISYKKFNEMINSTANSLIELGLKPGDRIATILPQSPAFVTLFMAASTMGLVVIPLDPRDKPSEMLALCERTKPKLLVGMANPEPMKSKTEELLNLFHFEHAYSYFGNLDYKDSKPYDELLNGSPDPVPEKYHPHPDDPLIIIFTSGTTGKPKGAVISHKNSYAIAKATVDSCGVTHKDSTLINMPVSHVAGTHDQIAVLLYAGGTSILCPTFNPQEALEYYQKYNITLTGGVPTMYKLMFKHCDVKNFDTGSIKKFIISGEPQSSEFMDKLKEAFPNATIYASFGMSETAGFFTFTGPNDDFQTIIESEGAPAPGFDMKVIRNDGTDADTGEVGELLVKGDSVINGYMDKKDDEGVFTDGWLRTGDLGFLDNRKYLHYVGRSKEMYKSGGYNVYPLEVEIFLNAYPGVNTSAVISAPHEMWGETGYAFIIPEDGTEITEKEIKDYCRNGLADYKQPSRIIIEKDVPRSSIGKVAKKELKMSLNQYIN